MSSKELIIRICRIDDWTSKHTEDSRSSCHSSVDPKPNQSNYAPPKATNSRSEKILKDLDENKIMLSKEPMIRICRIDGWISKIAEGLRLSSNSSIASMCNQVKSTPSKSTDNKNTNTNLNPSSRNTNSSESNKNCSTYNNCIAKPQKGNPPSNTQVKCPDCDELFENVRKLNEHVGTLHPRTKLLYSFKKNSSPDVHIKNRTKEKNFKCSVCSQTFSTFRNCARHEMTHDPEKHQVCEYCKKRFRFIETLQAHIRTHTGEKPYQCSFCPRAFSHSTSLRVHERTHTGEKKHVCGYCNKSFAEKVTLKAHIMGIHTKEKPLKCRHPGCESSFSQSSSRKSHEGTHSQIKPYHCLRCNKAFRLSKYLESHQAYKHKIGPSFNCSYCQKVIYGLRHLKQHERIHTNKKKFKCEECQSEFNSKLTLGIHKSTQHRKERLFHCSMCTKSFGQVAHLKSHQQTIYALEPRYICGYCGKRCAVPSALKLHMRVHTEEKPFKCVPCDISFVHSSTLKHHVQTSNFHKANV